MREFSCKVRASILGFLYQKILKPVFFRFDPENVHNFMTKIGVGLGSFGLGRLITGMLFKYQNPKLAITVRGIDFKNPIGLSAGFDKNAELTDILPSVGFGFAEVGSITGEPCPGNPKPRLWRLPKSRGLGVYYGLKSDGCEVVSSRLSKKKSTIPIGVSVAMTNRKDNVNIDNAIADYAKVFRTMEPLADYLTVNTSCPNTIGGQPFAEPDNFERLFQALDAIPTAKPVFIKLSPDMSKEQLDRLLDISRKHRIDGIICTNLTKRREGPKILDKEVPKVGGLSGKIVQEKSDDLLSYVFKREGRRFTLVGSGGVFSADDAYAKIRNGASLIQLITGMIYQGPQIIGEINRGLVKLLERDGFNNISEAVGISALL